MASIDDEHEAIQVLEWLVAISKQSKPQTITWEGDTTMDAQAYATGFVKEVQEKYKLKPGFSRVLLGYLNQHQWATLATSDLYVQLGQMFAMDKEICALLKHFQPNAYFPDPVMQSNIEGVGEFMNAVHAGCGSREIYKGFVDLLKNYDLDTQKIPSLLLEVSALFAAQPALVRSFHGFVANRISETIRIAAGIRDHTFTATQQQAKGLVDYRFREAVFNLYGGSKSPPCQHFLRIDKAWRDGTIDRDKALREAKLAFGDRPAILVAFTCHVLDRDRPQ